MADQRIQYTEEMVGASHGTKADTLNRLALAFALENDGTFQDHYVRIIDEKATTTGGGTFTSGAWRTRDLNTEDSDGGGHAALASNQITLDAGTYICRISAPGFKCQGHKAKLVNVTDTADVLIGTTEYSPASAEVSNRSFIEGRFTIVAGKALEVQHQCATTAPTVGFGSGAGFSEVEVYTVAEFIKVG